MRGVNACVMFISYPIYLRFLGFEQYGLWLVLSTVLMVSQLGNLGIVQAMAKVIAEEYERRDILAVRQYATVALAILAGTGAIATLVVTVYREPIVRVLGLSGNNERLAAVLLPYCAALSVYAFVTDAQTNTLAGLGRMDCMYYLQAFTQALTAGVAVLLLRRGGGAESLLFANAFARVCQHVLALGVTRRILRAPLFSSRPISRARLRHLARLSGGLVTGTFFNLLVSPLNRIAIARYVGIQAVPVYEIAFNGTMQIRNLLAASSSALLPEISRLAAEAAGHGRQLIRSLNRSANRALFLVASPLYLAIWLAVDPLLRLWLHDGVRDGQATAFRLALTASYVSLFGMVPYNSLLGLHRPHQVACATIVQSVANAAVIGAALLWTGTLTVPTVLVATGIGIAVCTAYLARANWVALAALGQPAPTSVCRDEEQEFAGQEL